MNNPEHDTSQNSSPQKKERISSRFTRDQFPPDEKMVDVDGTEYPKWAVEEAKELMAKYGEVDGLEEMVRSVLMFYEAKKKSTVVDPNKPGRAVTGFVSIIPNFSNESNEENL